MKTAIRSPRTITTLIEPLEDRIAPATLVNPTTVSYQDIDGDNVTVKITQPLFTAANVQNAFSFSNAAFGVDNSAKQGLTFFDVSKLSPPQGSPLGITISVHRDAVHGGNGHADVGIISAATDLGLVKIPGDLTAIVAGDNDPTKPGVATLDVGSIGERTEGFGSTISRGLGSLHVHGDVRSLLTVTGAVGNVQIDGSLGSLGFAAGIHSTMELSSITVNGNLFAGTASNSGLIQSDDTIGKVKIGGSILGSAAAGSFSATIYAVNNIASAEVGGDVVGGTTLASGSIFSVNGSILKARVGGALRGGSGSYSGTIYGAQNLGAINVASDVVGGSAAFAGGIIAYNGSITSVTVGGSLLGGSAADAGEITTAFQHGKDIGSVTVKGNVVGGTTNDTGDISANGNLASASIGGSLVGGSHDYSGRVVVQKTLGTLTIGGAIVGQAFADSGTVTAGLDITSVAVAHDVQGAQSSSGGLRSGSIFSSLGTIHSVFIGGDLLDASIIAGVNPGNDNEFGTGTGANADSLINGAMGVIAKVVIMGQAAGLTDGKHNFAIEGKNVTKLKVDGITYLHTDPAISFANGFALDGGGVVTVREI